MTGLLCFVFERVIEASWQASLMIVLVLVVGAVAGRRLTPSWRCALWCLVLVRLILPALPPSPTSVFNLRSPSPGVSSPSPSPLSPPPLAGAQTITYGFISDGAPQPLPRVDRDRRSVATNTIPVAWAAVAAMLLARAVLAAAWFWSRVGRLPDSADPRLIAAAGSSRARVVETSLVATPAVAGLLRPTLLFPPRFADRVDESQLRLIVLHELAHARRFDILVGLLTGLVAALHWFNPLAWLMRSRFRADRELACDADVLAGADESRRREYAETILRLLDLAPAASPPAAAAQMIGSTRSLRRRLSAVAAGPARWSPLGPILFLAIGCGTLTGPRAPEATDAPSATAASTPAAGPPNVVTRTYDVRDLLIHVPDFENSPSFDAVDADRPPPATRPTPTREQLMRSLTTHITSTVDPLSWRDNAGPSGTIRELNGQLLISQTTENHERLRDFLAGLRDHRSVQVTLEARFLQSRAAEERLAKSAGQWHDIDDGDARLWNRFLDDGEVQVLLRETQRHESDTIVTAPRITIFDGQRAYVLVSRQTAYVKSLKPSTTQPGEYDADVGLINSGVLLDARAKVTPDRQLVTLTLNPQLNSLEDLRPAPWPGAPPGRENVTVQVPHTVTRKLNTTITMPAGKTAVYRLEPRRLPAVTEPAKTSGRASPMLLLVRPTIVRVEPTEASQPTPRL